MDSNIDPVASNVFNYLESHFSLSETNIIIDDYPVMEHNNGNSFQFVRLNDVLSHNYAKYLPLLDSYFRDFSIAGIVNWHEGANSPDRILTVHTTGDTASGNFGNSDPVYFKNLICSLEENRKKYQLEDFRVMTEATHWSGIPYGQPPELITKYAVPMYDIEIGSTAESWNNETAVRVLAESLLNSFNEFQINQMKTLVCAGGIHFEESFSNIILEKDNNISIGHILANQWVSDNYAGDIGFNKLDNCMKSIIGKINGIIFHDNLKGEYKQVCRETAAKYRIYAGKHKILRTPDELIKLL